MHRVSVVGNSGSGKTTIAAELARLIGAPHLGRKLQHRARPRLVPGRHGGLAGPAEVAGDAPEQSIIAWAWTRHRVYRDRFLRAMIDPDNAQLRFIRLTTPGEVREFLAAAGQPG